MTIAEWLSGLGLEQYGEAFEKNAVDFAILPHLTSEDLREIGVVPVGHRRLLLDAIAGLGQKASSPLPAKATVSGEGERRQAAIVFADLVGFTGLSSELDAEEVQACLDPFFALADGAVVDFGGTVDKHIGDCVMGVFGAPFSHGDDTARAINAAIAIRDGVDKLTSPRRLEVHVGVASGEVLAGKGGGQDTAYSVTGTAVNLAARLCERAVPGEILISASVAHAIAMSHSFLPAGSHSFKGFAGPTETYRIIGRAAASPLAHARTIGRESERAQLSAALAQVKDRKKGQAVLLRGEPGIGKSHLLADCTHEAEAAGFAVISGSVLDFGGDRGAAAINSILDGLVRHILRNGNGSFPELLSADVLPQVLGMAERAIIAERIKIIQSPDLLAMLAAMDGRGRKQSLLSASRALLRIASTQSPILLSVEDIHWAEAEALDVLDALLESSGECAALMVATTRIEGDPTQKGWMPQSGFTSLTLGPLSRAEAKDFAKASLELPQDEILACIERSAGNPLFLDQLLRHRQTGETLPESIQSIFQARIDRLPPNDRTALLAASVLGQAFVLDDLRQLASDPHYDPATLVSRRFLRPNDGGLMFLHALVRDAAYAILLRQKKRELHRIAARMFAERDIVLAAEHAIAGADPTAIELIIRAGRSLLSQYRHGDAAVLARRAGSILPGGSNFSLLSLVGECQLQAGEAGAAEDTFLVALAAATTPADRCEALLGRASAHRILDRLNDALGAVDEVCVIADEAGLAGQKARALILRGNLLFPLGEMEKVLAAHQAALEMAREAGSAELEASALSGLGDADYMRGYILAANAHFKECVAISERYGLRRSELANRPMIAITQSLLGSAHDSVNTAKTAIDAAAAVGHERAELIAHHAAHLAFRDLCQDDQALFHAVRSIELARRINAPRFIAEGLAFAAQSHADRGKTSDARGSIEEALLAARSNGMAYMGPAYLGIAARLAEDEDQRRLMIDEAEQLLAVGSLFHNHLLFRREMIDQALERSEWSDAIRHADALAEAAHETSPRIDFLTRHGRTIARLGLGEEVTELQLHELADIAENFGDHRSLAGIRQAQGK